MYIDNQSWGHGKLKPDAGTATPERTAAMAAHDVRDVLARLQRELDRLERQKRDYDNHYCPPPSH